MKVLIVCSRRDYSPHTGFMAPFVYEQMKALESLGVDCKPCFVYNGIRGYVTASMNLKKAIRDYSPDIIHAHYGLCGLIANLQRRTPVVTTYHGTDLNDKRLRGISQLSVLLSKKNIVVTDKLGRILRKPRKICVIPCGIDTELLKPIMKEESASNLGWDLSIKHILFSKEFFNKAKNYPLAKAAVDMYNNRFTKGPSAQLVEFIGYSREQVAWLFNAVDCVLMTSDNEGSPQFIKEAMACNCPIVSVDVGDVKQVISDTEGCYIAERDPVDIASKINKAIKHGKTNGREKVMKVFDSRVIAKRILDVYNDVLAHE